MKTPIWILALIIIFVLSYFREIIFLGINELIDQNYTSHPYSFKPDLLKELPIPYLNKLKYALTAIFTALFIILSSISAKLSFKNQFPYKLSILIYSILVLIVIITIIVSFVLNNLTQFYPFIRSIVGYIHSPLIFLLVSATSLATNKSNNDFINS